MIEVDSWPWKSNLISINPYKKLHITHIELVMMNFILALQYRNVVYRIILLI